MEELIRELEELREKYQKSSEMLSLSEGERFMLKEKNLRLEAEREALQKKVSYYEECIRLSQHRQFASSSEKSCADARQLLLFDEAENEADVKKAEPAVEEITYTRRKRDASEKSEENYDSLPTERIEHILKDGELVCPECGEEMHLIGFDERKELVIIPAQVKVVIHAQGIYGCRRCERENTHVPIKKAPVPASVIKGSAASASAIAHIMIQKYMQGVPLYRQELSFMKADLKLSRQTMANWLLRAGKDWLLPLYQEIRQRLLKEEILHADETEVQVLREPGKASRSKSYMWLYRTGRDSAAPAVLFEYKETRSSSNPINFLKGFTGYLHTDGYSGYGKLGTEVRRCGCWAHVRRKFHESIKALPKGEQQNSLSQKGLDYCDRLFALEREYDKLTPEERSAKRLRESKPITDAFFTWAQETSAIPQSALGRSLRYAIEQRQILETFYLDGRLEISNNRAERSIKPFVIGRKNWLFCCSPKGAETSAVIYSVIETAKENGLKPFEYLRYLLETMPCMPKGKYHTLLPWSKELPESCRLKEPLAVNATANAGPQLTDETNEAE